MREPAGVKNIPIPFRDCDTDTVYGPIAHELATDTLPTWRLCAYNNEAMPHGYVKRVVSNLSTEIEAHPGPVVPFDVTGVVVTPNSGGILQRSHRPAAQGTGTGDEKSDTHSMAMTISFKVIDEMLPAGTLEPTPQVVQATFAVAA